MSDETTDALPDKGQRIHLDQDHEVVYWTTVFGISEEELRQVVWEVGDLADDVQRALGQE